MGCVEEGVVEREAKRRLCGNCAALIVRRRRHRYPMRSVWQTLYTRHRIGAATDALA